MRKLWNPGVARFRVSFFCAYFALRFCPGSSFRRLRIFFVLGCPGPAVLIPCPFLQPPSFRLLFRRALRLLPRTPFFPPPPSPRLAFSSPPGSFSTLLLRCALCLLPRPASFSLSSFAAPCAFFPACLLLRCLPRQSGTAADEFVRSSGLCCLHNRFCCRCRPFFR